MPVRRGSVVPVLFDGSWIALVDMRLSTGAMRGAAGFGTRFSQDQKDAEIIRRNTYLASVYPGS